MQQYPLLLILLVIGIFFLSGCTQVSQMERAKQGMNLSPAPTKTIPALNSSPAGTPVTSDNPIVGTWMCYSYPPSGTLKKVYVFAENNTYNGYRLNVNSRFKGKFYGSWREEDAGTYIITSLKSGNSATFTYNTTKDELYDPNFRDLFHRLKTDVREKQFPTMNITVHEVQKAEQIQGAHPLDEKVFLIVDISVGNMHEAGGFPIDDISIRILANDEEQDRSSISQQFAGKLNNTFSPGTIAPEETRRGIVLFGVPETSASYELVIIDGEGDDVSETVILDNVKTNAVYTPDTDKGKTIA